MFTRSKIIKDKILTSHREVLIYYHLSPAATCLRLFQLPLLVFNSNRSNGSWKSRIEGFSTSRAMDWTRSFSALFFCLMACTSSFKVCISVTWSASFLSARLLIWVEDVSDGGAWEMFWRRWSSGPGVQPCQWLVSFSGNLNNLNGDRLIKCTLFYQRCQ